MAVTIISPVAATNGRPESVLSARPSTLSGHVLGIIWNRLGRSDLFFETVAEHLTESEGLADVVWVTKASQSVAPSMTDLQRLAKATVAIAGFGGCGSCSARSMRDLLELDWSGTPGVWVGHSALAASARAIAALAGHPAYPMVLAEYPFAVTASWTDDEARQLAADLAPRVVESLVSAPTHPVAVTEVAGAPR